MSDARKVTWSVTMKETTWLLVLGAAWVIFWFSLAGLIIWRTTT